MATYVLVHGAWSGAHGFADVRRLLARAGHDVFTPSLTGIGERSHLTNPGIDLSTHVRDVVNTVLFEDLDEIVLLGFSYGGFVVTGALADVADRVAELVYLDAFVPDDGQRLVDLAPLVDPAMDLVGPGATWLVAPVPRELDDPDRTAHANARRVAHPLGCFLEPVRLDRPVEDHAFGLTFIKATGEPRPDGGDGFWAAHDRAVASPRWRTHEIATNHMVPYNRPDELAAVLLDLAPAAGHRDREA